MTHHEHLAVIGSGASAIYLLKHLLDEADLFKNHVREVSIFERSGTAGMGMPYNPRTTDRYNMSNISSEELPELPVTFADWLRAQEPGVLEEVGVKGGEISESGVYSRLALGRYLHDQYQRLVAGLKAAGMAVHERPGCGIADMEDDAAKGRVRLTTEQGERVEVTRVVIATGHCWAEEDEPERGYYASPWPIFKLLPAEGGHHAFAIGTLGASLSAFDVAASLAHRHGDFGKEGGRLFFRPHAGKEEFKIVMHSAQGLLPHLQFDQVEPLREIYRHVSREEVLALMDARGFLRLETFFDQVWRPALSAAFQKDAMHEMVELLGDRRFSLADFVKKMTAEHDYADAFEGMRTEMVEAQKSVEEHRPIHWKEVMDDLMYTLNFHAEHLPAEDHLVLQSQVLPFLMNVIAAMPLHSGDTLLALHDAGKLEMVAGKVRMADEHPKAGMTTVIVEGEDGGETTMDYRMFVDCSGQKPVELEDYPFPSLVRGGRVRKAGAPFAQPEGARERVPEAQRERVFDNDGEPLLGTGGVDIDGFYRLIDREGAANVRIHDIAFPHTSGFRPYSYGLQACSDTAAIVVKAWLEEIREAAAPQAEAEEVTELYERV